MKAIIGAKIMTQKSIVHDHVLIFDDVILDLIPLETYREKYKSKPYEIEEIETEGYLVPGFIDIHIHGSNGCDVMDADLNGLESICKSIIKSGTTSFLATTMTMSQNSIENALFAIKAYMKKQTELKAHQNPTGAQILGAHLEGPFINPEFKGAQNREYIQTPTDSWLMNHMDIIKMITYAPEMDIDFKFAKTFKDRDVVLSIGHSGCDFETAKAALGEGVTHITHCFNAMSGLHHRKPGVVGAALTLPFTVDIITDGLHIHPDFMGPFIQVKGIDKTLLITDAMRAAMMPEGFYDLGGQKVEVSEGCCKLEDGTLAGSVLSMDQALRNLINRSNIKFEEIIQMLSENPAKKLGIFDKYGSINVGKHADLVLLNDAFYVKKVYINGVLNYSEV